MRLTLAAAFLLLSSCSVYLPLNSDTPPPVGADVRARLTTPGAVRISDLMGAPVREFEGEVLSVGADSIGFGLLTASEYTRPWDSVDTLRVATLEIFEMEEKRLDRTRTAFLVGGVGIVTGVVIAAMFNASGGSEDDDSPGGIDAVLIPIFSIRR
jgi:hypothetical protein